MLIMACMSVCLSVCVRVSLFVFVFRVIFPLCLCVVSLLLVVPCCGVGANNNK